MRRGSRRNERRFPMVSVALDGLLGCGKMAGGQQSAVELTQRRSAIQSSAPSTLPSTSDPTVPGSRPAVGARG